MLFCFALLCSALLCLPVPVVLRQQVGSADPDAGTAQAGYRLVMHNVTRVCDNYVTAECIQQQSEDVCTADLLTKLLVPADSSDGSWQPQAIAGVVVGGAQQGPTDPQQQFCAKLVVVSCFLALGAVIPRDSSCHWSLRVWTRLTNRQTGKCWAPHSSLHAGAAAAGVVGFLAVCCVVGFLLWKHRHWWINSNAAKDPDDDEAGKDPWVSPAAVVCCVCTVLCGVACTRVCVCHAFVAAQKAP